MHVIHLQGSIDPSIAMNSILQKPKTVNDLKQAPPVYHFLDHRRKSFDITTQCEKTIIVAEI